MIDAIYTSKLYRVSKRKSAIVAAANNPVNTELVTQLADALSPVYKKEEYLVDKETEDAKAAAEKAREAEESTESVELEEDSKSTSDEKLDSKPSHNIVDSYRKAAKHEAEAQEEVKPVAEAPAESNEVENSTAVAGTPVTATRVLTFDMKQLVDEIKGLLNLQESTAGVNRILVKDSELWIYYNDSINLNNVMAAAIEALNASGYTYLEFNRLARSDNAMVFQIMFKDTDNKMKSIDNAEDTK